MKLNTMLLNAFIAFTVLSPVLHAKTEGLKAPVKVDARKIAPLKSADVQQGPKIVSIDSVHMLRNSREGKQLESAIQGEVAEFEDLVRKAHNDVNTEKDNITKQASVLSKEALEEKQQKLMSVKKQKELEITDKRETLMGSIQRRQITLRDKQIKVANQLLEEKGWSLIVEKNAPFVLGVAKALDVTDEVLGAVNKAFDEEASNKNEDLKKVEKEPKGDKKMYLQSTLGEINAMVGGVTSLDHSFFVEKIASLDQAGPGDLAIILPRGDASLFDQISLEAIKKSKAGVILTQKALDHDPRYFLVDNVLEAVRILQTWQKNHSLESSFLRHPSACIDLMAQLHDTVYVGPFAIIERDVTIGASSFIGPHAFIGKESKIGNNVTIHPGVIILGQTIIDDNSSIHSGTVIGSDGFGYQVNASGMEKIPHLGYVHIGHNVEIGANCSIDRAAFEKTFIGTGVKIDNNVHIAHGVHIGDHTAILALTGIAGSARIGIGCQIGGQVGIKDHVVIGNRVKIVSQSAVIKNVHDGEIVAGSPALPLKMWQRSVAALAKLPELFKQAHTLQEKLEKSEHRWWYRFFK